MPQQELPSVFPVAGPSGELSTLEEDAAAVEVPPPDDEHEFVVVFSVASVQMSKFLGALSNRGKTVGKVTLGTLATTLIILVLGVTIARGVTTQVSPTSAVPVTTALAPTATSSQSPLRGLIGTVSAAAAGTGALVPLTTVHESVHDATTGVDFLVSFADTASSAAKSSAATLSSPSLSLVNDLDPFAVDSRDPRLTVQQSFQPGYSLLLNKFNSVAGHVLLVTDDMVLQSEPLTEQDLSALHALVVQVPAVGFFNSAEAAGASQRHKHMQAIPLDVLAALRGGSGAAPVPIDDLLGPFVSRLRISALVTPTGDAAAHKVPALPFEHALVPMPKTPSLVTGKWLHAAYQTALATAGLLANARIGESGGEELPPHNLLMTSEWMLVVPRSRRVWGGIDVNAMGFFGCLLARSSEGRATIASHPPVEVLRGVTLPR